MVASMVFRSTHRCTAVTTDGKPQERSRGAGLCVHALTCARACVQGATAPVGLGEDADCASANCAYIASPAVRIRGAPAVRTACGGVNTTPVPAQAWHECAQPRRRCGWG